MFLGLKVVTSIVLLKKARLILETVLEEVENSLSVIRHQYSKIAWFFALYG